MRTGVTDEEAAIENAKLGLAHLNGEAFCSKYLKLDAFPDLQGGAPDAGRLWVEDLKLAVAKKDGSGS